MAALTTLCLPIMTFSILLIRAFAFADATSKVMVLSMDIISSNDSVLEFIYSRPKRGVLAGEHVVSLRSWIADAYCTEYKVQFKR